MEFFKKMGPRVILVEHQGKLVGLITIKDLLKYITRTEALDEEEDEAEVPGEHFGGRYRGGDLGGNNSSSSLLSSSGQWWSSLGSSSSPAQARRSSAPNSHGPGTRRSPPSSSSSPIVGGSGSHGKSPQGGAAIPRHGRSSSISGMTMASSIGSYRDRIELTEQDHRDILFEHNEYEQDLADGGGESGNNAEDEDPFYDQDEDEV